MSVASARQRRHTEPAPEVIVEQHANGATPGEVSVSEVRVLIVDDEDDMRALVRATIEIANQGLKVAGEAADGDTAISIVREQRPEVVVLDQRMPGATGLDTARRILSEHPDQAIVLFSSFLDRDVINTAEHLGVRMCLSKDEIRSLPEVI